MSRSLAVVLLCAVLSADSGCASYAHVTAGAASNLGGAAPAAVGGVLDGELGGGVGLASFAWPSVNAHVRVAPDLFQLAPSLSLRGALPALVTPVYGLGFRLLSFEVNDGGFGFGMFSPYLQLGFFVGLGRDSGQLRSGSLTVGGGNGLVLQAETGYDVRFTHQASSFWGAVSIGWATYAFLQ